MEYEVVISKANELKPKLNKLANEGWRVTQIAVRNSDLVYVVVVLERETRISNVENRVVHKGADEL